MNLKPIILSCISTVCSLICINASEWHVSTDIQSKKVLLEEFTGIHCGNCPDGHKVAADLLLAQPGNFFPVSIHAGSFASPRPGEPDFRTEESVAINDFFGVTAYPSGMINRHVFDGARTPVTGRQYWNEFARSIATETAPVNLWMQSAYDKDTRQLVVDVEGYFTQQTTETVYLTVYLCQNDIKGPQSGSSLDNEYVHKHMLRACLTPVLPGDPVNGCQEGEFFNKSYTYTVPDIIGDVPVVPTDLELVAFVCQDENEVLNATSCVPACDGIDIPLSIEIEPYKLPVSLNYGFGFVELYVLNKSSQPVTDAVFEVTLNDKAVNTEWKGEILPRSKALISLPVNWVTEQEDLNSFSVTCLSANGVDLRSNEVFGSFGAIPVASNLLKVQIKTDYYASDNTFLFKDSDGNVIKEFGPYPDGVADTYEELLTLENNKIYCLEITDAWADGMMSPRGRVRIYDTASGSDVIVTQAMEITGHGQRLFVATTSEAGVTSPTHTPSNLLVDIYNVNGVMVMRSVSVSDIQKLDLTSGVYILRYKEDGIQKCNKLIIN